MNAYILNTKEFTLDDFLEDHLPDNLDFFRIAQVDEVHGNIWRKWFLDDYINGHLEEVVSFGSNIVQGKYKKFYETILWFHDWREDIKNYSHSPILTDYPNNPAMKYLASIVRLLDKDFMLRILEGQSFFEAMHNEKDMFKPLKNFENIERKYKKEKYGEDLYIEEKINEKKYRFYARSLKGGFFKGSFPRVDTGLSLDIKLASLFLVSTKMFDLASNMDSKRDTPDEQRLWNRYLEEGFGISFDKFSEIETEKFLMNKYRNCLRVKDLFLEFYDFLSNHENFDEVFKREKFSNFVESYHSYSKEFCHKNFEKFYNIYRG